MPGYVDLQVNGYAGVDFNADGTSPIDFVTACKALQADSVSAILPTLITDDVARLCDRIRAIVNARNEHSVVADIVQGIHLEGPFLNPKPGFIGAHPVAHAQSANLDSVKRLYDASDGLLRIVTLAPECDPNFAVTRWLADQGIVVSAGHCDPSRDQLCEAIDAGLTMFTHLGNACPLQQHRHDNIIQRALSLADRLMIGFIADGIHVPFFALRNYLRLTGIERSFIVTDAISAAGQGPGQYLLQGQKVIVDEQLATWCEDRSHLVGSAITMPRVAENLRNELGLSQQEVDQLTRENSLRILS